MQSSDNKDRIYADHAASTPVDPRVLAAMAPFWNEHFANAGGIHREGVYARDAIKSAREECAKVIGARASEIIFTSGGTESNNLAIFGIAEAEILKGKKYEELHFVTIAIEHASVYECFSVLERKGAKVTTVSVSDNGIVDPEAILAAITPQTVLVSVMYVNSEIGTIQPIREIGLLIQKYRKEHATSYPYFHTDACQAPEYMPCQVASLLVDYMTIDAQKIYGPKASGFLFRRYGAPLEPIMRGGRQEGGMRPGTPPTPLIVGLAKALTISAEGREEEGKRLSVLRDQFVAQVLEKIPGSMLNGHSKERLPNNVNISFPGKRGEYLVLQLDKEGVAAATRSACHVGEEGGSHVVAALGRSKEEVLGAVRFSFGRETTVQDITKIVSVLEKIAK